MKAADKDNEQSEEQEEDDDGERVEERGTATRATTRLASRLEAERYLTRSHTHKEASRTRHYNQTLKLFRYNEITYFIPKLPYKSVGSKVSFVILTWWFQVLCNPSNTPCQIWGF